MVERMSIPTGLERIPPGPRLAALLAGLNRSRLNGHDLVIVMRAQARQVAHEQARLLADLREVSLCPPGGPDSPAVRERPGRGQDEFAACEISAALRLTRHAAEDQLGLAEGLAGLPAVHAALSRGEIDLGRARVIVDGVAGLPPDLARVVADAALLLAPRLTGGQLRARLAALVITADPDAAARRYRRGVAARRVVHGRTIDATAYLSGCDLPADRAAAAWQRINAVADELKRGGDPRSLDHLRAEVYLDLLAGHHHDADPDLGARVGDPATAGHAATDGLPADHATTVDDPATATDTAGVVGRLAGPLSRSTASAGRAGVTDVVVSLTTLIGLSDQPGVIPGWGPVIAEIARRIAAGPHRQWRLRLLDQHGQLIDHATLRTRPTPPPASRAGEYAFVKARDRRCRFPTCRVPARHCQVDHTVQQQHGGWHDRTNLALLCTHHHRGKDQGGYRLLQLGDGALRWTTPLGHTYDDEPDPPT